MTSQKTSTRKFRSTGEREKLVSVEGLTPYRTEEAYLEDLDSVLRKDYGAQLNEKELKEAGRNIEIFLANFL